MPKLPKIFGREFKLGVRNRHYLTPFEEPFVDPVARLSLDFSFTKWLLGAEWWLSSWDLSFSVYDPEIILHLYLPTLKLFFAFHGPMADAWARRKLSNQQRREFRFRHALWKTYRHGDEPRMEDFDYIRRIPATSTGYGDAPDHG
jgi:hypothetical protein